jgi:AAA family ATP:ADP antiporter
VCLANAAAFAAAALAAGSRARDLPADTRAATDRNEPGDSRERGLHAAWAGARLVARSRYLLSIVCIVALYEIVSTVMDFQFTSTVAHYLDGAAIGRQFSRVFAITNAVSVVVQLGFTGLVMRRLGVGAALVVLPAAIFAGSTAFLALPTLWIGSFLNTADNAFAYSINQSAKEALYVPTSSDEKYHAKAFIDMFVQRFAKAVAVGVSLAITTWFTDFAAVRWLSLLTLALLFVWLPAVRYAGRRFRELAPHHEAHPPA